AGGRGRAVHRQTNLDEIRRREVGTGITTAMRDVTGALARQDQAAELVLVAVLVGREQAMLVVPALGRNRTPVDERTLRPDGAKSGARRAHRVVHFPARARPIALVGFADRVDDLTAHRIAKIGEAMERLRRPPGAAQNTTRPGGGP